MDLGRRLAGEGGGPVDPASSCLGVDCALGKFSSFTDIYSPCYPQKVGQLWFLRGKFAVSSPGKNTSSSVKIPFKTNRGKKQNLNQMEARNRKKKRKNRAPYTWAAQTDPPLKVNNF